VDNLYINIILLCLINELKSNLNHQNGNACQSARAFLQIPKMNMIN